MAERPARAYARVAAGAFLLVALYTILFKREELADDWAHTALHVATGAVAAYAGWAAAAAAAARVFTVAIAVAYGALGIVGWFVDGIALEREFRIPLRPPDNLFHLGLALGAVVAIMVSMRRGVVVGLLLCALAAPAAEGGVTRLDRHGTVVLDGRKVFPIVLAKGPPREGLAEVAAAGVRFVKVGPASGPWTDADVADALAWNRAAARHGLHTWINLSAFAQARPGGWKEQLLRHVVGTLEADESAGAIGMWKGADEPWKFRMRPQSLRFAYCLMTGRGQRRWCAGRLPIDRGHLWVTVQAPRAGVWSLAPYAEVTDVHGVNHYPIAIGDPDPDLGEVGAWTNVVRLATPTQAAWTTLQICWRWSYDAAGGFVVPTYEQQRFMIYDAIVNGARALAFYGGQNPRCFGQLDAAGGWNWTYWERVLERLVREIGPASPLAPALVNPGTTRVLPTSDPSVQAISRRGRNGELWVIATRRSAGEPVGATIGGVPAAASGASVYGESRVVTAADGALSDSFAAWAVHVYRL